MKLGANKILFVHSVCFFDDKAERRLTVGQTTFFKPINNLTNFLPMKKVLLFAAFAAIFSANMIAQNVDNQAVITSKCDKCHLIKYQYALDGNIETLTSFDGSKQYVIDWVELTIKPLRGEKVGFYWSTDADEKSHWLLFKNGSIKNFYSPTGAYIGTEVYK